MSRLRAFPGHRYIGTRDDMAFYDCDEPEEFAVLSERVTEEDLIGRTLLSAFSPDTPSEARNRGFTSPR